MPTYNFKNKETGEVIERLMKIKEMEEYLENNPNMEMYHGTPIPMGDPIRLGLKKPDGAFRDILKNMKGTFDSKYTKSSINTW